MKLKEIESRLAEIKLEINNENPDLDALETEVNELKEARQIILDKIEKRKGLIEEVKSLDNPVVIEQHKEERKMETNFDRGSMEYRNAFLKNLRNIDLSEMERRAFTTVEASAGAVIPTETVNRIIEIVEQHAPLLEEIDLVKVPGGVALPLEDTVNDAETHTENTTITASNDKLKVVNLFGYEVVKLLQISKSVTKMSVNAFETWLANSLGKAIANKISALILAGTGSNEAKGLSKLTFTKNTNSIEVTKAGETTAKDITDLIGLLNGGYDANAKFLMSKKTLFQDIMHLQDASKNDLVTREGNNYFIYGYPVMLDERMAISDIYLGDFLAGYKANMPEDVNVVAGFDIDTNSYKYLGSAIFDGKPAVPEAFVKLVKLTA